MIRALTGTVSVFTPPILVLEVGGVGYEVLTSTLSVSIGQKLTCAIFTVVKEDSLTLYGFKDETERGLFALLISVNGVGPKSALGIMGQLSVEQLSVALDQSDAAAFSQVKGIGKKVAERIVLDLTGRVTRLENQDSSQAIALASALENLGYKKSEYQNLLKNVPNQSIEKQVLWALKELGNFRSQ